MRLQIFGTAALPVLLLAVPPVSAQKRNAAQSGPAQRSVHQAAATTTDAFEEHLSLAAYFGELASQERVLADSYSRLVAIYENKTPPPGTDGGSALEMTNQYKRLAEAGKRAAAAAARMAAYHTRVAGQVVETPVPTVAIRATQTFASMGK
jgi:hypothetical protein